MPTLQMSERLVWMTDADLVFGDVESSGVDFAANASNVRWAASGNAPTFTGLKPSAVWTGDQPWNLEITLADDYEDAESFWSFLWDNAGTSKKVTLRPRSGGVGFEGVVAIVAGGIGGTQASPATSTVTLTSPGRPTRLAALVADGGAQG